MPTKHTIYYGIAALTIGIVGIGVVYASAWKPTVVVSTLHDIAANSAEGAALVPSGDVGVGVEIVATPTESQQAASPPVVESVAAADATDVATTTTAASSVSPPATASTVEEVEVSMISVTLRIVPIGASSTTYAITIANNATVYEVMQQAKAQGFTFKDKNFPGIGRYVTQIAGVQEDKHAGVYWSLYLNGAYASVGASSARVHDGDMVTWKFEKK